MHGHLFFHFLRHWCLLPVGQVFKFALGGFLHPTTRQTIDSSSQADYGRLTLGPCREELPRYMDQRDAEWYVCQRGGSTRPPSTSAWTASPARWTQNAPKVSLLSDLKRRTVSGTLVLYVYWSFLFNCQNGETLSLTHTHCAFPSSHTFLTAGSLSLTGFNGDVDFCIKVSIFLDWNTLN